MNTTITRVLLVEDDDVQRTAMAHLLRSGGHEVVDCATQDQAIELFGRAEFDVLVADFQLANGTGIELIRRIRKIDPSLCAIVVTVHAHFDTAVDAMREGAVDFVTKPLRQGELESAVLRAIGYRAIAKKNELLRQQIEDRFVQLQEVNEQLNEFAGRVAHDLRSPVRSTRLWVEFARESLEQGDTDEAKKYLESALRSIGSGTNIIDGLLALSKSVLLEHKPEKFSLRAMIDQAVETCRFEFKPRVFEVQTRVIGAVTADVVLLGIAVNNLIHNAFKYSSTREKPRIDIVAEATPQGWYSIKVQDNGIGIDVKQKDLLFKPFGRLASAREFVGEGIGLTTVKRVVEKHGGTVSVESVPGEGLLAEILLPPPQV